MFALNQQGASFEIIGHSDSRFTPITDSSSLLTFQAWLDFAAKNYPFVVDCGGLRGQFVAVRLLNVGRPSTKDNEAKNFVDMAPMSLCEIEVEEA